MSEKKLFLDKLRQRGFFSYLDHFLASRLLKTISTENENQALALCYLMKITTQGHPACKVFEGELWPSLDELFSEELLSFEEKKRLQECLLKGFASLPLNIVQRVEGEELDCRKPLCVSCQNFYFQRSWVFETKVLKKIRRMLFSKEPSTLHRSKLAVQVRNLERQGVLLKRQALAIIKACKNKLSVISGGPGTGKSYLASLLVKLFVESSKSPCYVAISAPTGKASHSLSQLVSKHLGNNEQAKVESLTLHRLLRIKRDGTFEKNYLPYDLIIVDEASMVDARLLYYLLECLLESTTLVLIGDKDQLPPVEGCSYFADLHAFLGSFTLTRGLRFDSELKEFSKAINAQKEGEVFSFLEKRNNIFFLSHHNEEKIKNEVLSLARKNFLKIALQKIDPRKALDDFFDFGFISCLRQGSLGVDNLNTLMFRSLINRVKENTFWSCPIIVTRNDFQQQLFNGTLGVLVGKGRDSKMAYFLDDQGIKEVVPFLLPSFDYAFFLSVHKSQGTEFNKVLLVVPQGSEPFGKEIIYTACTRAKKELIIAAKGDVLRGTILNRLRRRSSLLDRLRAESKP